MDNKDDFVYNPICMYNILRWVMESTKEEMK